MLKFSCLYNCERIQINAVTVCITTLSAANPPAARAPGKPAESPARPVCAARQRCRNPSICLHARAERALDIIHRVIAHKQARFIRHIELLRRKIEQALSGL